jgi:predicted house-cleaning noncanonical NTP pyrophosphatase (MazG superfamily)
MVDSKVPTTKLEKLRSLQDLSDTIEKQTRRVIYRIANDSKVDPELSNDLRKAVDEFLQKAEERINRG